ncbi:class I SAM-dependent methyltransferase [Mycolicibacterium sp. GCM10028919]|uniref:class I SAM-dependent methyltransferase n=1 Tax=Mycolicibacterium sp. GCM10028919 TaxID=3273401 RepID=UPI003606A977
MPKTTEAGQVLAAEWDGRYAGWSMELLPAEPNPALLAEAARLRPGRALDIGCGVGSDAIWLAARGWDVTALDVSQVALDRAADRAEQAGVSVEWQQSRLEDAAVPPQGFDLVTAHYPALLHSSGGDAERALLASVTVGGTLLVVHHADVDVATAKAHGFDPADYLGHDDVAALFDDTWEVRIDRGRLRSRPAGSEGQHTHDDVLVARRLQ